MATNLLSYDEVLNKTNDNKRFLLLGNGFSMSYNYERFSFTSLLESAVDKGLISKDSPIYAVFKTFDTKDFEEVVKLLETSVVVLKEYSAISEEDEKLILSDSLKLKEYLVDVITNNHPEKITEISDEEFMNSAKFIKEYDKVYTLNYDLLLYWTTMKLQSFLNDKSIKNSTLKIQDGFHDPHENSTEYVVYRNDSMPFQIFYLHGALHIYDKKSEIIKNTYSRTERRLREQTLENLKKDIYPIFVSEGTSEQKYTRILHNAYLNHCYKSLSGIGSKKIDDSLIIFGTLIKRNDAHIRQAILKNNVSQIFIGVSSENEVKEFDDFIAEIKKRSLNKEVYFYDYRTAIVWR